MTDSVSKQRVFVPVYNADAVRAQVSAQRVFVPVYDASGASSSRRRQAMVGSF